MLLEIRRETPPSTETQHGPSSITGEASHDTESSDLSLMLVMKLLWILQPPPCKAPARAGHSARAPEGRIRQQHVFGTGDLGFGICCDLLWDIAQASQNSTAHTRLIAATALNRTCPYTSTNTVLPCPYTTSTPSPGTLGPQSREAEVSNCLICWSWCWGQVLIPTQT